MNKIGHLIFFILFAGICYAQNINKSDPAKNSPAKNLQLAKNYLENNNEEKALLYLNICLSQRYDLEEALFLRARIYNNKNQLTKALSDYNGLIDLNANNKEYYFNRAFLRYKLEQYELAVEDFYISLKLPGSSTQTAFFKIEQGSEGITRISTIHGMESDTWNYIGLCHQALGNTGEAVASYTKGIEIDPESPDLYINRALSYEKVGNIKLALNDYEYVLSLFPDHPIARYNLLNLKTNRKPENQLNLLDDFVEKNPTVAQGYVSRGLFFFDSGNYKYALIDFLKAVELDSNNTDFLFNLALTYEKLNKLNIAEQYFDEVIELDENHAGAHFNLGNIQYKKGAFQEAVSFFTLAHRLDNNNPYILYNRAITQYNLGMIEEACRDIELVRKLDEELGRKFFEKNCGDN